MSDERYVLLAREFTQRVGSVTRAVTLAEVWRESRAMRYIGVEYLAAGTREACEAAKRLLEGE